MRSLRLWEIVVLVVWALCVVVSFAGVVAMGYLVVCERLS